ncbi:hypothetical protein FB45DRAFT_1041433 [Roridomyces roridus]|uniref:F-box domain-containing protein n=1 Tax=Roridomyces roridus TaxID=1738132 RepID=A0AAD7B0E7_9AGAR|nr:hypothetical protein FB45DRAFT_1041433 [Roridomyces roridus]
MPPTNESLHNLFTTNVPPLDSEAISVKRLLTENENRVAALDAQIDELAATLDLVARAEQYKAVLAPMRRLPPELLCEIFAFVPPCTRRIKYETVESPPWRLGQICRAWREVALGYTSLWKSFTIIQEYASPLQFSRDMLETQLVCDALNCMWDLFLPLCHRWASLRIHSLPWVGGWADEHPGTAVAEFILQTLQSAKGNLPQLERIELLIDCGEDPWEQQWDVFSVAPRLREVILTGRLFGEFSPQLSIPWNQITRYRGCFLPVQHFINLQTASNLVDCSLASSSPCSADFLWIRGGSWRITAPALKDLMVDNFESDDSPPGTIADFVRRSCCQLESLMLTRVPPEALVPLLIVTPSLERLILERFRPEHAAGIYTFFATMDANPHICANLSLIVLRWPWELDPDWATPFCRMIHSRNNVQQERVCRVVLFCECDHPSAELTAGVLHLQSQGVDIKFGNPIPGHDFLEGLRP